MRGSRELPGETVLRRVHASGAAWANVLDFSGATNFLLLLDCMPWHSLAAVAVGLLAVSATDLPGAAFAVVLVGGVVLGFVEAMNRQDFITTTHVVRQSGLLGKRRIAIPLVEIQRVEYSLPRFRWQSRAGNVDVIAEGQGLTFIGVSNPEELAEFILRAKDRALRSPDGPERALESAAQQ